MGLNPLLNRVHSFGCSVAYNMDRIIGVSIPF